MDTRLPAEMSSELDETDRMIIHALDDFGLPHLISDEEPHLRHCFRADQAARCCAGRRNGRPHPDQGPLAKRDRLVLHSHLDRDAPKFSIPELIRDVICVVAMLAMLFGMLMIPEMK